VHDHVPTDVLMRALQQPAQPQPKTAYVPSIAVLLRGLGVTELQPGQETVAVSTAFLRFIVSELVSRGDFDPAWYAARYPDVEGARLAGQVSSLHQHYCTQGYFEGRAPGEVPVDPDWYYSRYADVSQAFSPADPDGICQHYRTQGWREGRAGTPEMRKDADRWLEAAGEKR
jgi:hypothetical protein